MIEKISVEVENLVFLTEKEAKILLSRNNLDNTYLLKLFIPIEKDSEKKYVKQLNFDFCINIINEKKDLERSLPKDTW